MLALCDVVWCGDGGKGVGFPEYKAYFSSPWGGERLKKYLKKRYNGQLQASQAGANLEKDHVVIFYQNIVIYSINKAIYDQEYIRG